MDLYPDIVILVAVEVKVLVLKKKKFALGRTLQTKTVEVKWQGWGQTCVIFTLTVMLQHFSQNLQQDMRNYEHRVIEGFIAMLLTNLTSKYLLVR